MPLTTPPPPVEQFQAMQVDFLLNRFAFGVEHFDRRLVQLKDEQLDMAFLDGVVGADGQPIGRWPIRVLLGHLADAEVAFTFRMRKVVGEAHPTLEPWDENAFIDSGLYGTDRTPAEKRQPVGAFIATIFTLRKWTAGWLRTLDPSAFDRKGLHTVRGEQTLKTIIAYDTWHLEHHGVYLNRKINKLTGTTA
jgi:hypothetical protein